VVELKGQPDEVGEAAALVAGEHTEAALAAASDAAFVGSPQPKYSRTPPSIVQSLERTRSV